MSNKQPRKTGRKPTTRKHRNQKNGARGSQRSAPSQAPRTIRLRPEPREQIDATTLSLCYWLLAQRIVQEAEDNGDLTCPDSDVHDDVKESS